MSERPAIHIPDIAKRADTAIRRVNVFLGLALNAVLNPDFKDYELSKLGRYVQASPLNFAMVPDNVPSETVEAMSRNLLNG